MASSVISAFDEFLKDTVNITSDDSSSARTSRDWLKGKIKKFPEDDDFPVLYSEKDIDFGSFTRKTKIRPLDDLDLMICLNACGSTYNEYSDRIDITVSDTSKTLKKLCYDGTHILNSIKVVNKFVSSLKDISQYKNSKIKRNQESAVLELTRYDWNFDIVPCFFTSEDVNGKTYYFIPNGSGSWKKTDPRIDRERTKNTNQSHNGNVLNVIRIMKYWTKRETMPTIPSYLIENMILDFYGVCSGTASTYVDMELPNILLYIRNNIESFVSDPKGIQGNINTLTDEEKVKVYNKANDDYEKSLKARELENESKQRESINQWREIFGSEFPTYS